jgi:hypothetical protein
MSGEQYETCLSKIGLVYYYQHTCSASLKNSALRVGFSFYIHGTNRKMEERIVVDEIIMMLMYLFF